MWTPARTRPCRHFDLILTASINERNKFLLFIIYSVYGIFIIVAQLTKTEDSANLTNIYPLKYLAVYSRYGFVLLFRKYFKIHMSHFNTLTSRNEYIEQLICLNVIVTDVNIDMDVVWMEMEIRV